MTSDVVRTQVYLHRTDHQRLKQLAARRGVAMTELAREAVARYVAEELDDQGQSLEEMVAELRARPMYAAAAAGPAGLVDRMHARASDTDRTTPSRLDPADQALGDALADEHDRSISARPAAPGSSPGSARG